MKRCKLFTWSIINIFLLVSLSMTVSAGLPADVQHRTLARDSLKMLDSLVNSNKILNNLVSRQYAKRALVIATLMNSDTALANAYKMLGIAYFPSAKDTSFFYFNAALKIADSAHILELKIPVIYNLAMIFDAAYNYKDAIRLLDSSIVLAKSTNDYTGISRAY